MLRDFFQIWVSAFLTEDFEYTFHFVLLGETGATTFQIVKSARNENSKECSVDAAAARRGGRFGNRVATY